MKQIFFIGAGATKEGVTRKYEVAKGATRLFLVVMDGYEWNNNQGAFGVEVTIERTEVTSNMFSVETSITFADRACLPHRSQCTPDRPVVKETGPGQYHVLLPTQMEWGASVPVAPVPDREVRAISRSLHNQRADSGLPAFGAHAVVQSRGLRIHAHRSSRAPRRSTRTKAISSSRCW